MFRIDRNKHSGFEDDYADLALGVITSNKFKEYSHIADSDWAYFVLSEFYKKAKEYGLIDTMGLEKISEPVTKDSMDDLRCFMKSFLLAKPEQIHKAHEHLKPIHDAYVSVKRKKAMPPAGFSDFSEDLFLKCFQENDYKAMCNRTDSDGVKYNVRILRSLGIRSCPYCGCEYIGGRGTKILGAELDHFVNKSMYPFFALCLYNLIPSCSACNNHKSAADDLDLVSPLEEKADFDSNIGIRIHSRPYVRVADEMYHESCMAVKVTADRDSDEYSRYKRNIQLFNLEDIYDGFEREAALYMEKMTRYPKTQVEELERILAMGEIDEWQSRVRYRHQLEKDLFLDQCAQGEEQAGKPVSKMYTDLYRTYRKPKD